MERNIEKEKKIEMITVSDIWAQGKQAKKCRPLFFLPGCPQVLSPLPFLKLRTKTPDGQRVGLKGEGPFNLAVCPQTP